QAAEPETPDGRRRRAGLKLSGRRGDEAEDLLTLVDDAFHLEVRTRRTRVEVFAAGRTHEDGHAAGPLELRSSIAAAGAEALREPSGRGMSDAGGHAETINRRRRKTKPLERGTAPRAS